MTTRILLTILLTVLYVVAFAAGSFLHPFGVMRVLESHGLAVRLFVWDGVLLMLGFYLVTLAVEMLGRRLRTLASWTTASVVLAGLIGYLLRFGFVTRDS